MSSVLRETWRFQKNVPGLTSDCGIDTSLPALGSQSWPLCACLSITQPQGRDLRTQAQRQCCERLDTEVLEAPVTRIVTLENQAPSNSTTRGGRHIWVHQLAALFSPPHWSVWTPIFREQWSREESMGHRKMNSDQQATSNMQNGRGGITLGHSDQDRVPAAGRPGQHKHQQPGEGRGLLLRNLQTARAEFLAAAEKNFRTSLAEFTALLSRLRKTHMVPHRHGFLKRKLCLGSFVGVGYVVCGFLRYSP